MLKIIFYTHSDFSDIWPISIGQINYYIPEHNVTIFSDKINSTIPKNWDFISYDDNLQYSLRLQNCLKQMKDDTIIFLHEDMILYDYPNLKILEDFFKLVSTDQADNIKLIKTGNFNRSDLHENLIITPIELRFSIQPTIIKISKLLNIVKNINPCSIWDFEIKVAKVCENLNHTKCFMSSTKDEKKRGLSHWDSKIFPYIATAICKGRWNYKEYPKEIDNLAKKFNIDLNKRGLIL